MNEALKCVEEIYKDKFGQFIALMLQRFNDLTIDAIEDIVQDVFAEAAARWPKQGIPQNPEGWIYNACKNKSINLIKQKIKTKDLSMAQNLTVAPEEIDDHLFHDARMKMLLACCHPELSPKMQVVLALKYIINFKVENIALQLGAETSTIEKMLYRARQKIKNTAFHFNTNVDAYPKTVIPIVHKVIYLIFNEGYKQVGTMKAEAKALCEEALILNKFLLETIYWTPETKALQALMLFNLSRFQSRYDKDGNFLELEYQNRNLWKPELIELAGRFLTESKDSALSSYHLEAAIAFVHCSAKKFEDTDWKAVCKYYEALLKVYPSPFAEINYAVALQYDHQDKKAQHILTELRQNRYVSELPLLKTAIKKFFDRTGIKI